MATLLQLKKLEKGNALEQQEVIETLLRGNGINAEVVETLLRVPNGPYLPWRTLVELLAKANSRELYLRVKNQLFGNVWAMVELLRLEYPDPEIEEYLLDKLMQYYNEDEIVIRKHIVEALGDRGSLKALRLLTELLDEHVPKAALKTTLAKAMQATPNRIELETSPLMAAVEIRFVAALRLAIKEISRRAKEAYEAERGAAPQSGGSALLPPIPRAEIDRVVGLKDKAWLYLDKDTKPALQYAREVVEIVLKALCRQRNLGKPNKPLEKLMVGALLELAEGNRVLPAHIEPLIGSVNRICGTGLHDQGADIPTFSIEVTRSVLLMLDDVVDWFIRESQRG